MCLNHIHHGQKKLNKAKQTINMYENESTTTNVVAQDATKQMYNNYIAIKLKLVEQEVPRKLQ
jgi:hypothetical protein